MNINSAIKSGIGRAVVGAGLGIGAGAGWNALSDKKMDLGTAAMWGAGLMVGGGLIRGGIRNAGAIKKGAMDFASKVPGYAGQASGKISEGLGFAGAKGVDSWFINHGVKLGKTLFGSSKNPTWLGGRLGSKRAAFVRSMQGVPMGAAAGAVGGALYGAFSPNESMFGGAIKGAILGSVGMGLYRGFGGSLNFSKWTKGLSKFSSTHNTSTGSSPLVFTDPLYDAAKRRQNMSSNLNRVQKIAKIKKYQREHSLGLR